MIRHRQFVRAVLFAACAATVAIAGNALVQHSIHSAQIASDAGVRFRESSLLYVGTVARLAEQYLVQPARYPLELIALARSASVVEGSLGVTISGFGSAPGREIDTVWASSEAEFLTSTGALRYQPGRTRVQDELSARIPELVLEMNRAGNEAMADLTPQIDTVTQSILDLLIRTPAAEQAELAEADEVFRVLYQRGSDRLAVVARSWAGTEPDRIDPRQPPAEILVFHPVATMDRNGESWYTGMVRFRRSTEPLVVNLSHRKVQLTETIVRSTLWTVAMIWGVAVAAAVLAHLLKKEVP
ncbi:MAG: hypothetical protein EA403_00360 [Spirochaetaceae bacterium]|nr:MAG: hypothetical protein EA403_00360 [Spirochaetaceae bacterium]